MCDSVTLIRAAADVWRGLAKSFGEGWPLRLRRRVRDCHRAKRLRALRFARPQVDFSLECLVRFANRSTRPCRCNRDLGSRRSWTKSLIPFAAMQQAAAAGDVLVLGPLRYRGQSGRGARSGR